MVARLLLIAMLVFMPAVALAYGQPLILSSEERENLEKARGKVAGEVVFTSLRDGKWRLFRINADGTQLSRLSLGQANYIAPEFIQNGRRLIYHSDENGPMQIFVAQPDMSAPRCLSVPGQEEYFAGLSHSGLMLVYNPHRGYFLRPILGGSETTIALPRSLQQHPGWVRMRLAPDGKSLAVLFEMHEESLGRGQMFVLDLDEQSGRATMKTALGNGDFMGWSKDSKALIFIRANQHEDSNGTAIWFWEDSGHSRQINDALGWNVHTSFALDGPGIVWARAPLFTRDMKSGRYDIWLQQANGKPLRLTQHSAPDLHPSWRPQTGEALHQEVDFIYDARQYATGGGLTVTDSDAPGWLALESSARAEAGLLLATCAEVVPPGQYQALFRFKLVSAAGHVGNEPLLRLEVGNGEKLLLESLVLRSSFVGPGYNVFAVDFKLDQLATGLHLKVYTLHDHLQIRCDSILLQSNAPAPWYAAVLELWRSLLK